MLTPLTPSSSRPASPTGAPAPVRSAAGSSPAGAAASAEPAPRWSSGSEPRLAAFRIARDASGVDPARVVEARARLQAGDLQFNDPQSARAWLHLEKQLRRP
ncbi:MAG TPA: hypothetical protein VFV27_11590 [Nevskiaceae bacterium]|nr:hypothetical protein [Nevskiaceae bacterium]